MTTAAPALVAEGLTKRFRRGRGRETFLAVDNVDFSVERGRALAIVGESGSGKTTVARLLVGLYRPTTGTVEVEGEPLPVRAGRRRMLRYRGRVQMIFQDPFSSLNPVKTIGHHVVRPLALHHGAPRRSRRARAAELIASVGLEPAHEMLAKYPHELSGGQRQRVAFAAALAADPDVIVADEPTSMLDVSIRLELLNLIRQLKQDRGVALVFITHDLGSARYVADEIIVMYAGQVVERAPTETLVSRPAHPYTQLLLSAVPDPARRGSDAKSTPRGLRVPAQGCRFADRCPLARAACTIDLPELTERADGHAVRCIARTPVWEASDV